MSTSRLPGGSEYPATVGTAAVLKPAGSYDEPQVQSYTLGPGDVVQIAPRDFQRALVLVSFISGNPDSSISIGPDQAIPVWVMSRDNTEVLIRYVDYLTCCTSEIYLTAAVGGTFTVVLVREH